MAHSSAVTDEIVETVADMENATPAQLPPLGDHIDAKTYQLLISPEADLTEPLTFEYLFYDVTVLPDREIIVTP